MAESTCVAFLEWALPRLGLAWPGFRRVHRQVCKRVGRRLQALQLRDALAYRAYLDAHPQEWTVLDSFCRISISRWVRDRAVFEALGRVVLPALARGAIKRGERSVRCWSAGCASGEEPYSLSLLWRFELAPRFPALSIRVLATDIDKALLERARAARYARSSLREVPAAWIERTFERRDGVFTLRPEFRSGVEFQAHDIRQATPAGPFDLILCRNLAFTYFDAPSQRRTLERILAVLKADGALVIGLRERLPEGVGGVERWVAALGIYRRASELELPLELSAASVSAVPAPVALERAPDGKSPSWT